MTSGSNELAGVVHGKSKSMSSIGSCSPSTGRRFGGRKTSADSLRPHGSSAHVAITACVPGMERMRMTARKRSARRSKRGKASGESRPTSTPIPGGKSTASSAGTRARKTAAPEGTARFLRRASAVSSSGLLMRFARALWSERIRPTSEKMLPGLGGSSELAWNRLVTLCSPSDCGPVALGLAINANDCSCSPSMPTPTASDWKGGKIHVRPGMKMNLRDWWKQRHGQTYPDAMVIAAVMGFPPTWAWLGDSVTPSCHKLPSGSAGKSSAP